jgi:hypothetical protein
MEWIATPKNRNFNDWIPRSIFNALNIGDLRCPKIQMMPVCRHWTQPERSKEVGSAVIEVLRCPPS